MTDIGHQHGRAEVIAHLVDSHRWPDVARYDAGFEDLDDLHSLMHDPERFGEAVDRLRGILAIPGEPEGGDAA